MDLERHRAWWNYPWHKWQPKMTDQSKPPPFAAAPTHTWSCEGCGASQTGPEDPGYTPWCPICDLQLTKTPIAPPAP